MCVYNLEWKRDSLLRHQKNASGLRHFPIIGITSFLSLQNGGPQCRCIESRLLHGISNRAKFHSVCLCLHLLFRKAQLSKAQLTIMCSPSLLFHVQQHRWWLMSCFSCTAQWSALPSNHSTPMKM